MKKIKLFLATALIIVSFASSCITPFEPKGVTDIDNMFVVEGDILINDTTIVTVSYSQAIGNKQNITYVNNAQVWVENETGTKLYGLYATKDAHRVYKVNTTNLNPEGRYKLCVILSTGRRLETKLMKPEVTPPIDSVGYNVNLDDKSVTFYVNTHDNSGKSKYFRWRYDEDWEFHSIYPSAAKYNRTTNKLTVMDDWSQNRYFCWNKDVSRDILVASTENLTEDRIYQKRLVRIISTDLRISYVYSMLLHQTAISKEAFRYWENMRKISDDVGGIFAPQPSELKGNIECINAPDEKVLGYISVTSVQKKRIFAYGHKIGIYDGPESCENVTVNAENPMDFRVLWDGGYDVFSYSETMNESVWAPIRCVDCRVTGTKIKPSYWPTTDV